MVCLTKIVDGKRTLVWFCNECKARCNIAIPPLEGGEAVTFLPSATFQKHNHIPATYPTRMCQRLAFDYFLYIVRRLPLRRAPGPDGVPNELI
mmetsp:Transcript_56467/g.115559  ORF Transcript_56467/g.115559 Transcript_56467/m.115559 type:complete len:93 (+) Transcript_56467:1042-1320(+)